MPILELTRLLPGDLHAPKLSNSWFVNTDNVQWFSPKEEKTSSDPGAYVRIIDGPLAEVMESCITIVQLWKKAGA